MVACELPKLDVRVRFSPPAFVIRYVFLGDSTTTVEMTKEIAFPIYFGALQESVWRLVALSRLVILRDLAF